MEGEEFFNENQSKATPVAVVGAVHRLTVHQDCGTRRVTRSAVALTACGRGVPGVHVRDHAGCRRKHERCTFSEILAAAERHARGSEARRKAAILACKLTNFVFLSVFKGDVPEILGRGLFNAPKFEQGNNFSLFGKTDENSRIRFESRTLPSLGNCDTRPKCLHRSYVLLLDSVLV